MENIFGKQRGRFDEVMAERMQRGLTEEFMGAFHAMPLEQKRETIRRFNDEFQHEHCSVKFKISET